MNGAPSAARKLIAIAGNPNTGKTTLFNVLTGSRARVGNYPGVTVDRRVGESSLQQAGQVSVLDIPGTYSLVARTAEERWRRPWLENAGSFPVRLPIRPRPL